MTRTAPGEATAVRVLADARGTATLFLVLVWTFALELLVWSSAGREAFTYWFVATAEPTPGWLLSWAAHSPFRPAHVVTSVVVLWVYGPVVERTLGARKLAVLFVGAGLASTALQTLLVAVRSPAFVPGTLGASGGGLALLTYVAGAGLWHRASSGRWPSRTVAALAVGGTLTVALVLANDFAGLGLADGTARFGHLAGVSTGLVVATIGPTPGLADGRA